MAMTACVGERESAPSPAVRTKNGFLKDIKDGATSLGNQAANGVTGVANDVANAVVEEVLTAEQVLQKEATDSANLIATQYKNAQNQIVDSLGNLIEKTVLVTRFPDDLGLEAIAPMLGGVSRQLKGIVPTLSSKVKSAMGSAATSLDKMSAAEAERTINGVLGTLERVASAQINLEIPGAKVNRFQVKTPKLIAPYMSPFKVAVKENQWVTKRAVNVQVELDFLGLKKYTIGLACLGWPKGLDQQPTFVLNGGCNNEWGVFGWFSDAELVRDYLAPTYTAALAKTQDEVTKAIRKIQKTGANPRNIPALAIDIPLNELIDAILNREIPSLKNMGMAVPMTFDLGQLGQLTVSGSDFDWSSQPDDNSDGKKNERDEKKKKRAADRGGKGAGFSLYPELEVDAAVSASWSSNGQIQFDVGLGWFGIELMTVGMSCLTFGTSWKQQPTFTSNGGCDNKWNIEGPSQSYFTPA